MEAPKFRRDGTTIAVGMCIWKRRNQASSVCIHLDKLAGLRAFFQSAPELVRSEHQFWVGGDDVLFDGLHARTIALLQGLDGLEDHLHAYNVGSRRACCRSMGGLDARQHKAWVDVPVSQLGGENGDQTQALTKCGLLGKHTHTQVNLHVRTTPLPQNLQNLNDWALQAYLVVGRHGVEVVAVS